MNSNEEKIARDTISDFRGEHRGKTRTRSALEQSEEGLFRRIRLHFFRKQMLRGGFATVLLLFQLETSRAEETSWINAGVGDWFITSNWSNYVPDAGLNLTDAIINNNGTALLNRLEDGPFGPQSASANSLALGNYPGFSGTLLVSRNEPATIASLVVFEGISIGSNGGTGTLHISKGASVQENAGGVGIGNGTLTVVDASSRLSTRYLSVGGDNRTGTLNIQSGGQVATDGAFIAVGSGSTGTVTITGPSSLWDAYFAGSGGNYASIGQHGNASLTISNGGKLMIRSNGGQPGVFIADYPGATGSVIVTGSGSSWINSGSLYVGGRNNFSGASVNGGTASLNIRSGGFVQAAHLKFFSGSTLVVENGSATVAGLKIVGDNGNTPPPGGTLGDLGVGGSTTGRVEISGGGTLFTNRGYMDGTGGDGFALVTGAGSKWTATGSIWVGNGGIGGLEVTAGGVLASAGNGYLGFASGAAGHATVSGEGSAWTSAASLYIGGNGAAAGGGGSLLIADGGVVSANSIRLWTPGTLQLGANPLLQGPLTVSGGIIQAVNHCTFPNNFALTSEGATVYTGGFDLTFSGSISGPGGLLKAPHFVAGLGTLTLTGNNNYTGATTVGRGKLVIDGSITSAVTVNNNGTLGGRGTVGSVTINSGGVFAPGNSPGRMTINGDYTQNAGGILNIEIGGATAGQGYDQLAVSGNATLNGTLNLNLVNGFKPAVGDTFTIITSTAKTGNFASVNASGFTVSSDSSSAGMTLTVTNVQPGVPVITSPSSASGTEGQPFPAYQITATDSPTTFAATGLPAGLSVNTTNGLISGTPAVAGTFDVTISAANSAGTGFAILTVTIAAASPGLVGNVSTRLPVGTGDDVLIEGFIVQGPQGSTKKIIVRAIGPSLIPFGITDAVVNPTLEIHDSSGATVATNNDWKSTQTGGLVSSDQAAEINSSGLAPSNDLESAIIANLVPGSYTAVVRGVDNATGTGVVDAYDLSGASAAKLANIATRGLIQPGDKLMIAGFIVQSGSVRLVVRAIGPSLFGFGINNALPDTTLQLRDQNGVMVRENDNWRTDQQQELESTGLQPTHDLEAALLATIPPGQYTAQVRGKDDATGIGVVQVYFLE